MNEMIIEYSVTDAAIEELRQQYGIVETVWNNSELGELKSNISVVRTLRTSVEATRKELKKDALEYGRKVDTEAKRITALLHEIEDPMKAEQARFEAIAENERLELARIDAERVAKIQARIDEQTTLPLSLMGKSVEEIGEAITVLESPDGFDYQELAGAHAVAVMTSLPALRQMHTLEIRRAADMAAVVERDRLAEMEREKLEVEREKFAAEQKVKDEEAERERAAAEAERDRLAEIERENLEAEREKFAAEQRIKDEEAERERAAAEAERKRLAEIEEKQLAREREELDRERRQIEADKKEAKEAAKKTPRKTITCPHCGKDFEATE